MKRLNTTYKTGLLIAIAFVILSSFTAYHKFYVSVTQVEYVKEKQSLQFISRIFIDDFENLLQQRFDETIVLNNGKETDQTQFYIEKYLKSKIKITINGEEKHIQYIGKEYENDIMYCYYEIENIPEINSIKVSNEVLFDLFDDQQNIMRLKIHDKHKTFVLIAEDKTGLLNFN